MTETVHEEGTNGRGNGLPGEFLDEWRNAAYNCYSSGHKFCREVCPVTQVTRDESAHADRVPRERRRDGQGPAGVEDVARTTCTARSAERASCAVRTRCSRGTSTASAHARSISSRRSRARGRGGHRAAGLEALERADRRGQERAGRRRRDDGLPGARRATGRPTSTCRPAARPSSSATARRRSTAPPMPRAVAKILKAAGVEFGLMREQWCCGGPAAEMGYRRPGQAVREPQRRGLAGGRREADPRPRPARLHHVHRGLPDVLRRRLRLRDRARRRARGRAAYGTGSSTLSTPVETTVTYHDACRLNKRKGIHEAPREILRAIPGLTFKDVDHVTQWSYCSGGGAGLPIERPDLTAEISRRRLEKAAELEVDTLVSACVWSERPLAEQGRRRRSTSSI